MIDVLVALPELADGTATAETVARAFRHMLITRIDTHPVCRLRLEARWEDDGTIEGEVSQEFCWVDTLDEGPPEDDKKHAVAAADRGLIQLYYTPANRNPSVQVRSTTGALGPRGCFVPSNGRTTHEKASTRQQKTSWTHSRVRPQ